MINDTPEREVKVEQAFFFKNEKEARQYLLQVVLEHWIKFPYAKRSLVVEQSLKKFFKTTIF
jgi:hypothetical protein